MKVADVTREIERFAPPVFQESYDNSGLICGDPAAKVSGVLLSLDCTEAVVEEAVKRGCNLIVSHHPILFSPLKKLTPNNYVGRTLISAIRNNVGIYACHTNLDNVRSGVNRLLSDKLGLQKQRLLAPKKGLLRKLVTFVPFSHLETVRQALFNAGAGHIGDYDSCSFSTEGEGTFRGQAGTDPFLGKPGVLSTEKEHRLEVIADAGCITAVTAALHEAHPYEEVAFDIISLENAHPTVGSGMTGELENPLTEQQFMERIKTVLGCATVRHTALTGKKISKVAVCGGSGSFLLRQAIGAGADAFVTADFKYHEFFDVEGKLLLVDAGHYETEHLVPQIFYDLLDKKFSTFAIHLSKTNTNPVNYF